MGGTPYYIIAQLSGVAIISLTANLERLCGKKKKGGGQMSCRWDSHVRERNQNYNYYNYSQKTAKLPPCDVSC